MQNNDTPVTHSVCVCLWVCSLRHLPRWSAHRSVLWELHRRLSGNSTEGSPGISQKILWEFHRLCGSCTPLSSSAFSLSACVPSVSLRQRRAAQGGPAGQGDRASSCAWGDSEGWTRGGISSMKGWLDIGMGCPGLWLRSGPWKCLRNVGGGTECRDLADMVVFGHRLDSTRREGLILWLRDLSPAGHGFPLILWVYGAPVPQGLLVPKIP